VVRITHFREKCIGCNYCEEVAPDRWAMNAADGKSDLLESRQKKGIFIALVTDDEYEANMEAAEICPVNIIRIEKY